jgi:hypothetical protein
MAINETMQKAWKECTFYKQSDMTILALLRDESKWDSLPLEHACGWKRISQVGFPRLGRDKIWRDLCRHRGEANNSPSYDWTPSVWMEGYCEVYKKIQEKSQPSK